LIVLNDYSLLKYEVPFPLARMVIMKVTTVPKINGLVLTLLRRKLNKYTVGQRPAEFLLSSHTLKA
jgi:hypothetical protein